MIKINKHLAFFSGLFLILGVTVFFIAQKLSPLIGHATYYCQSYINTHMTAIPYYLGIIPFVFIFVILTISLIKVFILTIKVQFLKHTLNGRVSTNNKVKRIAKNIGLQDKIVVISSDEKYAFCLGIRVPKIYISTGLISKLTFSELEAVLRHEQYHLENYDTFTMIIASVGHSLFPFFPLIGDLIKKYRVEREIAADKFAVEKVGSSESLILVLKKLLEFPTVKALALAAIADQDTLEPRIYSLINKPYTNKHIKPKHLIITMFSTLLVASIIAFPVHAKEIHHDEHDVIMVCTDTECMNSCSSDNNLKRIYSEIPQPKMSSQTFTPMH